MENQQKTAVIVPESRPPAFFRSNWISIAFDIAMSQTPTGQTLITGEQICNQYGMTEEECLALFTNPEFKRTLKDARRQISALGEDAGLTLQMRILGSDLTEKLYARACKDDIETKDLIRIWERMMSYGLIDPATNGTNKASKDSGGGGNAAAVSQVIFQLPPGVPGLEHMYKPLMANQGSITVDNEDGK